MSETRPSRLKTFLASPRMPLFAVLAAVVLNLPSLGTGWHLDDLLHRAQFLDVGPLMDPNDMTNRMFDFLSGEAEDIYVYKEIGVLPWWSADQLKIRFWRPLSSFTHVVDYTLWPDSGVLMHSQSLVWLALLVGAVATLYRRTIAIPLVAGLATILYALDDARGFPVGFLANRNAIIAAFFGVSSLALHDIARRTGSRAAAVSSPIAFAAALLSGESGLGAAPYLLGYALFVERDSVIRRLTTIIPHGIVGIVWLAYYAARGFGTFASEFYIDPVGQPTEWLAAFFIRAPMLLLGQWFIPPSSFAFAYTAGQAAGVAVIGTLFMMAVFVLLRPVLRADPMARSFAFGMLVSVIPITAGFPHDRLLFFVGVGATALLAMLLVRLFDRDLYGFPARLLGWAFLFVHIVIAIPFHVLFTTAMPAQETLYAGPARSLPNDPSLSSQRLLVVNPPSFFYGQYNLIVPLFDDKPAPKNMLLMAPGTSALSILRESTNAVTIEAEKGWLGEPFDNLFRSHAFPVPEGYRVDLGDVQIEVVERTSDDRPKRVRFLFQNALNDPGYRWVRQEGNRLVPFRVPAVGERVELQAIPFNIFTPETN